MAGRYYFTPACGKETVLCNSLREQKIRQKLHTKVCLDCQGANIIDCGSHRSRDKKKTQGARESDHMVRQNVQKDLKILQEQSKKLK